MADAARCLVAEPGNRAASRFVVLGMTVTHTLAPTKRTKPRPRPRPLRLGLRIIISAAVVTILPFAVLVRTSVHLHHRGAAPGWIAVSSAFFLTLVLLTGIAALVSKKLTGKFRLRGMALWVALPLVVAYAGYSLLYLSSANAKSQQVRAYYHSLHPVLRIAVSTLILVDHDLIVTDLRRSPSDYTAMGLPIADASRHYPQSDGYVHVPQDLRQTGMAQLVDRWILPGDGISHAPTRWLGRPPPRESPASTQPPLEHLRLPFRLSRGRTGSAP